MVSIVAVKNRNQLFSSCETKVLRSPFDHRRSPLQERKKLTLRQEADRRFRGAQKLFKCVIEDFSGQITSRFVLRFELKAKRRDRGNSSCNSVQALQALRLRGSSRPIESPVAPYSERTRIQAYKGQALVGLHYARTLVAT